jgi:hypothetical protein
MTDEELQAIAARAEAATVGPWKVYVDWKNPFDLGFGIDGVSGLICPTAFKRRADATFCAHARTDIPALLAEIERLQAEVARLEEEKGELAFFNGQFQETIFKLENEVARLGAVAEACAVWEVEL